MFVLLMWNASKLNLEMYIQQGLKLNKEIIFFGKEVLQMYFFREDF